MNLVTFLVGDSGDFVKFADSIRPRDRDKKDNGELDSGGVAGLEVLEQTPPPIDAPSEALIHPEYAERVAKIASVLKGQREKTGSASAGTALGMLGGAALGAGAGDLSARALSKGKSSEGKKKALLVGRLGGGLLGAAGGAVGGRRIGKGLALQKKIRGFEAANEPSLDDLRLAFKAQKVG